MIFDTHAHYDDEKFDSDRAELLSVINQKNVNRIINVGASLRGCKDSLKLAEQYDFIYAALGIHPEELEDLTDENLIWLSENLSHDRVVALGEIGLDYYWCKEEQDQAKQKVFFIKQLEIAQDIDIPVIIHSREAAEDTMSILKEYRGKKPTVIHCYSYSKEIAQEYLKLGYYIGVGGVVTFKNAKKLVETVEAIPIEKILIETDSPYMAPTPYRGERNDSSLLKYVIERIAEIKKLSIEDVENITYQNALDFYRLQ